jgi:hypothetical protein
MFWKVYELLQYIMELLSNLKYSLMFVAYFKHEDSQGWGTQKGCLF